MVTLVSVLRHSMKTDFEGTRTEVGSETCDQNKSRIEKKKCVFLQVYWNIHGHNQHLHQDFDHYGVLQHAPKKVA